jgi:hypothetical protein
MPVILIAGIFFLTETKLITKYYTGIPYLAI